MLELFIYLSLVSQSDKPEVQRPEAYRDLPAFDLKLFRRRLESAHGEMGKRQPGVWEVASGGKIYEWTWDGDQFTCPPAKADQDPIVSECKQWTPTSFRWFQKKEAWLQPWTNFKHAGYLLESEGKPQVKELSPELVNQVLGPDSSALPDGAVAAPEQAQPTTEAEAVEDELRLGGKRLALEAWDWSSEDGKKIRVYTSLRNSWVERIDSGDLVEYIEWKSASGQKQPMIQQVIVERSGQRIALKRKAPPKAQKPKKP